MWSRREVFQLNRTKMRRVLDASFYLYKERKLVKNQKFQKKSKIKETCAKFQKISKKKKFKKKI